MKQLFYSEITHKYYETEEDCLAAEEAVAKAEEEKKAKAEKRAERAKEVEEAYNKVYEAKKEADKLLSDFCETYGSYHQTIKGPNSVFDYLFDHFFNF